MIVFWFILIQNVFACQYQQNETRILQLMAISTKFEERFTNFKLFKKFAILAGRRGSEAFKDLFISVGILSINLF